MQTGWSLIESANCTHTHTQAHGHGVCKYAGDVHHITDDQIHSDLACIPLDRDWAAYRQVLKGESAGGKREQLTAPIIYEKPALISFNMYIERYPARPAIQGDEAANRQERDARRRAGPGRLLPGFHQGLVWHRPKPHNDLLAVHAGVPEEEMAVRSAHTHTPMQARWRLPQCCYSAIPRAKPHIIEHFSKVLAKAQRKVSIHSRAGVLLCHPSSWRCTASSVHSIQHLRDALQDLH